MLHRLEANIAIAVAAFVLTASCSPQEEGVDRDQHANTPSFRGSWRRLQTPTNLPPGCYVEGESDQGRWISCPGCRYNIEKGDANEVVLSNMSALDAKLIASASGFDVLYSEIMPTDQNGAGQQWYGYDLQAQANPFTDDANFDESKIECNTTEQHNGDDLWLRWDPKREGYIFLTTRVRNQLIATVTSNMHGCQGNLISGKTDVQLHALIDGLAEDDKKNWLLQLVNAAITLSYVLIPEVDVMAPMFKEALSIANCGEDCQGALSWLVQDPDGIKSTLGGLAAQGVSLADTTGSNAAKEVEFATEASKFFLQMWEDATDARRRALPSMTNQWLYALQEIYSPDSDSGSNCTVDNASKVMETFYENMGDIRKIGKQCNTVHCGLEVCPTDCSYHGLGPVGGGQYHYQSWSQRCTPYIFGTHCDDPSDAKDYGNDGGKISLDFKKTAFERANQRWTGGKMDGFYFSTSAPSDL